MKRLIVIILIFFPLLIWGQKTNVRTVVTGTDAALYRGADTLNPYVPYANRLDLGDALHDQTSFYNVLDYGAVGNGTANDTDEIQACIDAAIDGTVLIPSGTYLVDSLRVDHSTFIQGVGWGSYGGGTIIKSTSALPVFHIVNITGQTFSYGAVIRDLQILGNGIADDGTWRQTGINVDTEGDVLIERVYITACGDCGIRLGNLSHTSKVTIRDCRIGYNDQDGIYGRSVAAKQINAINILNSEFNGNHRHGISVVGNNVNIKNNTIQGNDSVGVMLSARDMGAVSCNSQSTTIEGNYFEENAGGNIKVEVVNIAGPVIKYHEYLRILNNYIILSDAVAYPATTASMIFKRMSGDYATTFFRGMEISGNNFTVDGAVLRIDFNGCFSRNVSLEIGDLGGVAITTYYDLSSDGYEGGRLSGQVMAKSFAYVAPTAVGGITVDDFMNADLLQIYVGSAIDISANPQIDAGFDGQLITIKGNSDTNTLKLDDGTGLMLAGGASCTLGDGDNIVLMFTGSTWKEISRSDN